MPRYPADEMHMATRIPPKVHRRAHTAKNHRRNLCSDDRNYIAHSFTITGDVAVGNYAPQWRVDKDFWVANVTAEIGRHDSGTHPADGTPGGQPLNANIRVQDPDGSNDRKLFASDNQIAILADNHTDKNTDAGAGPISELDFDTLRQLFTGEKVYVRVGQIGTSRPGSHLVVTLWLVPIRTPETVL